MVSIHRPSGYEPNTLPLRQGDIKKIIIKLFYYLLFNLINSLNPYKFFILSLSRFLLNSLSCFINYYINNYMNHYIVVYLFLNSSFVLCLTKGGGDVGCPLGGGVTHGLSKSGSGVIDGTISSSCEALIGVFI